MPRTSRLAKGQPRPGFNAPGEGSPKDGGMRVTVVFDPETFGQIKSLALVGKTTLAHTIRQLVEQGLEAK